MAAVRPKQLDRGMAADLIADTTVRADPATPGRYHLVLPDHWDFLYPCGGVVMACALRAAEAELADPGLRFASATTVFCSPVRNGPLVAEVVVLRRGASAAQLRVGLRDGSGEPGLELLATFMRSGRKGPDVRCRAFPEVRALADAPAIDDGARSHPGLRWRFHDQLEYRLAEGERFYEPEFEAGPGRHARWVRYRSAPRDAEGRLVRFAVPPVIDSMPGALHRAIGPGEYRFRAPSLDLTTYVIDDTTREWLLISVTARRAKDGWAIADAEVWDDEGRYIAYGAQAMFLVGLAGEAPTVDASGR